MRSVFTPYANWLSILSSSILVGIFYLSVCPIYSVGLAQTPKEVVSAVDEYFPDQEGNEWRYRGRMIEGGMVEIAEKQFTNVSTVIGEEVREGMTLTVFHDTNPGDQGPSDSYYRRDAAGIRYYGSKPGTTLEKQLIPYQIVRFPIEIPSSFQQLDRKDLDLGLDLDRDGRTERVDVQAVVTVVGKEDVTVPLGTFSESIRLEARMTMDVHLTHMQQTVRGTDTMTAWFGRGIGLLKYVERQTVPSLASSEDKVIELIEELEEVTIKDQMASLGRGKSSAQRVLRDDALHHELLQIPWPSRLFTYP
ncbi:MAG: hypothetical protein JSU59_06780 [Nitrospirota bacterium]|nr:MAG: hypothetical protein JSU59_06780 [Nitrospirota bacterium]